MRFSDTSCRLWYYSWSNPRIPPWFFSQLSPLFTWTIMILLTNEKRETAFMGGGCAVYEPWLQQRLSILKMENLNKTFFSTSKKFCSHKFSFLVCTSSTTRWQCLAFFCLTKRKASPLCHHTVTCTTISVYVTGSIEPQTVLNSLWLKWAKCCVISVTAAGWTPEKMQPRPQGERMWLCAVHKWKELLLLHSTLLFHKACSSHKHLFNSIMIVIALLNCRLVRHFWRG